MQFSYMSEEEIAIARIKNIEEINIYDLVLPNNENEAIVFGLMVFYDNGKSMNYCEVDSCFEKYKQKIFSQYEIEYRDNEIKMDSKTKAFMESSNSTNIDPDIEFYLNAKAYEEALINYGVEILNTPYSTVTSSRVPVSSSIAFSSCLYQYRESRKALVKSSMVTLLRTIIMEALYQSARS